MKNYQSAECMECMENEVLDSPLRCLYDLFRMNAIRMLRFGCATDGFP